MRALTRNVIWDLQDMMYWPLCYTFNTIDDLIVGNGKKIFTFLNDGDAPRVSNLCADSATNGAYPKHGNFLVVPPEKSA